MRPLQSRLARALPFYYGWVVFGGAVGISFSSRPLMSVATLSVFLVPMTQEFGWSRGFFSGAVSLGGICAVVMSPLAGRIIDRYGSGMVLAIISTIAGICGIGLAGVSQQWMFYSLYVPGRAVFAGPMELGTSTAVSNWFLRRRPFALALLSVWQGIGLASMPLVAQVIISGWGWRTSWAALGIYTLALGVLPVMLLMVRRPEDLGLEADGSSRARSVDADSEPAQPSARSIDASSEQNLTVGEAMRTRAFWILALFSLAGFIIQAGVSLHQVAHFISQGVPGPVAALTASTFAIAQTIGVIVWARLARRVPLRFLLSAAGFMAAMGTIGIAASSTLIGGAPAAFVLGMAVGGFHLLLRLIFADYYGRQYLGGIRGVTIGAQISGQVLGPLIAGLMFDYSRSYWTTFLAFAAAVSLASLVVLAATPPGRPVGRALGLSVGG
jgi:MFS family permease